jgi:hypothetical protein
MQVTVEFGDKLGELLDTVGATFDISSGPNLA